MENKPEEFCPHSMLEMESECTGGACPLCLQKQFDQLKAENQKLKDDGPDWYHESFVNKLKEELRQFKAENKILRSIRPWTKEEIENAKVVVDAKVKALRIEDRESIIEFLKDEIRLEKEKFRFLMSVCELTDSHEVIEKFKEHFPESYQSEQGEGK